MDADRLRGKALRRARTAADRARQDRERPRGGMPELVIPARLRCPDCAGGACPVDGRPCPAERS